MAAGDAAKATRLRPPGWSKELVLELATSELGIQAELKRLAATVGLKWRTLYSDISTWRAKDPRFDARYRATRPRENKGGRPKQSDPDTFRAFVMHFRATGRELEACEVSGLSPSRVRQLINPNHRDYRPAYAEAYRAAEHDFLARLAEVPVTVATDPDVDARTRAWAALQVLEKRDRERYGKHIDMTHQGRVEHEHRLEAPRRREILAEQLGGFYLTAGKQEGQEEDVVDAEVSHAGD